MTDAALRLAKPRVSDRLMDALPVLVVSGVALILWYALAVWLNAGIVAGREGAPPPGLNFVEAAWSLERPLLPVPHQIVEELWSTIVGPRIGSPRNLLTHVGVTLSSTLLGFVMGVALGVAIAIGLVTSRALDKSLTPWLVASQTVPILAIAPIVITALGSIGLKGLVPKAIISAYLCFFPVAIGMAKGLASPDAASRDLMRTYAASDRQTLLKLRFPAALPFLFASLKVAVAAAFVGAIVAELPTGAQSGLGARLLAGSYYGSTLQIWAALAAAAIAAASLVSAVALAERIMLGRTGSRS